MFNKYKEKFIEWVEDKIGIGELRKLTTRMKSDLSSVKTELNAHKKTVASQTNTINTLHDQVFELMKVVNVGVDVNLVRNGSWAVICLNGKSPYVKFVQINETRINDMVNFIEEYKDANIIIDAPSSVRNLITPTSTKTIPSNR